jgi:hypothetical protein
MSRSKYWEEVRSVVRQSRLNLDAFDPDRDDPAQCVKAGVRPIVSLYVRVRRDGATLSDVERSLLSGELNDWLSAYARAHGTACGADFTVHEVAMAYARDDSLERAVRRLLGLSA